MTTSRPTIVNGIDVTAHSGLIGTCVHRYRRFIGGCLEREDLFQAGWLGVHHAAERFDHSRGLKFSTYAQFWIRAFVQRCVMNERRTVRIPVHRQGQAFERGERLALDPLSLDSPFDPSDPGSGTLLDMLPADGDPSEDAERSYLAARVEAAVGELSETNRRVIEGRFWTELTLNEIGDDLGVSRERIRQRQADSLGRLGRTLGKLKESA